MEKSVIEDESSDSDIENHDKNENTENSNTSEKSKLQEEVLIYKEEKTQSSKSTRPFLRRCLNENDKFSTTQVMRDLELRRKAFNDGLQIEVDIEGFNLLCDVRIVSLKVDKKWRDYENGLGEGIKETPLSLQNIVDAVFDALHHLLGETKHLEEIEGKYHAMACKCWY